MSFWSGSGHVGKLSVSSLPFTHTQGKRNGIGPYPFHPGKSRDSQWGREKVKAAAENSFLTQKVIWTLCPPWGIIQRSQHSQSFFWTVVSTGVALWLSNFPLPIFPRFSTFSCPTNCPLCPKMHHLSSVPKPKLHWFLNGRAYRCSLGPGRFQNWGKKNRNLQDLFGAFDHSARNL